VILAPMIAISCSPPVWIEAPQPELAIYQKISGQLQRQTQTDTPATAEVLLAIFEFPESSTDHGELSLSIPETAGLPRFGLILDLTDVLNTPGLYLGVQNLSEEFVHLVRLGDPREIRSELEEGGKLQPEIISTNEGVIAARIPFEPEGDLRIFGIENNTVSVVYLDAPLGPAPFPGRGWPGWPR